MKFSFKEQNFIFSQFSVEKISYFVPVLHSDVIIKAWCSQFLDFPVIALTIFLYLS